MKAYLQIILLAIFIIGINGVDVCGDFSPTNPDEDYCRMFPTPVNYTHCCYFKSDTQTDTIEGCQPITDDQYENIKRFKNYMKQNFNYDDFKIKCSGEFLTYSLFALLALLF